MSPNEQVIRSVWEWAYLGYLARGGERIPGIERVLLGRGRR